MWVKPAVEGRQIPAHGQQFVELREDVLPRQDITALLPGEPVESTVVALRHADVRVVDDPHDHVRTRIRLVKAASHPSGQLPQMFAGSVLPQPASLIYADPLTGQHCGSDPVEAELCCHNPIVDTDRTWQGSAGPQWTGLRFTMREMASTLTAPAGQVLAE